MAADSDGRTELQAVVTCDGDLTDPRFPAQLEVVVGRLNDILGEKVKVRKLEPWNSVRVTLSIPREAALRLRQLANEGAQQLRALGILSVQVEGDQVISLRLAGNSVNSEPQEIILRTSQDASTSREHMQPELSLPIPAPSATTVAPPSTSGASSAQVQFKSPNVVCPADSVVPTAAPPKNVPVSGGGAPKAFAGPFPFTSMNQAMHCGQNNTRDTSMPPPYPVAGTSKQSAPTSLPPVTISSPLLVNLLQNDGTVSAAKETASAVSALPSATSTKMGIAGVGARTSTLMRPPPQPGSLKGLMQLPTVTSPSVSTTVTAPRHPSAQTNIQMNNSVSPSALSNTSIRQNSSTILTSTITGVANSAPPPPPPQYHRTISATMVKQQQPGSNFSSSVNNAPSLPSSLVPNTSLLSQTSFPPQLANMSQPSLQLEHPSIYQSQQSTIPQSKSMLAQPSSSMSVANQNIPNNSMMQPSTSLTHPKPSIVKKSTVSLPPKPTLVTNMQKNVNIPLQQKTIIHNNITSQPQSNYNMAQIKNTFPIDNMPVQKSNNFANQTNKMQSNSYATPNTSQVLSQSGSTNSNSLDTNPNSSNLNNVMLRSLPSPPPYSIAIARPWDSLVHTSSLMDLMPTLTDLKADDLDELLPSLTDSPLPELPEDFLAIHSSIISSAEEITPPDDNRKFLINPLTGELEPQSSDESEVEDTKDVFNGLPSPAALSDDDTCSTTRPDTTTDQSDSETRSSDTSKPQRLKNSKVRDRGRDSPALKPEKIKLRLKLEKSEPINPAYKVDVSFINTQPKKASTSIMTGGEELRVPPLHISLRGRNSVVIKNKSKFNPDGTPKPKIRKNPDQIRLKKSMDVGLPTSDDCLGSINNVIMEGTTSVEQKVNSFEPKKVKKIKTSHDTKELIATLTQDSDLKSKFSIHNHYKEKQKERRGSDSELVRNSKKYVDNGALCDEKKRRLSQVELDDDDRPPVLGSTNIGTIAGLPQKPRKDKVKIKDVFRKDPSRNKLFSKTLSDKLQNKAVTLPTAGEMDMEAKFKQGLLEGTSDKGILRPQHRTEVVNRLNTENTRIETTDKGTSKLLAETPTTTIPPIPKLVEKSPPPPSESSKGDAPDTKLAETADKPAVVGTTVPAPLQATATGPVSTGSRSPGNGASQGEDSGIESMDALSEKSPNQASQSPHADLLPTQKTQVPNMLDIEAQLAKMEGLNGDGDHLRTSSVVDEVERTVSGNSSCIGDDINENHNKSHRDQSSKMKQCCETTCALTETLKGSVSLSTALTTPSMSDKHLTENSLVPLKVKKEEDQLDPLPVRVTPALYTYSNPDKNRGGSESPAGLSDEDSNSCSTSSSTIQGKQSKSLLEQLLIEIPNDHQNVPSSPSPVTRSVRTRALSKMGSPELSSPVPKGTKPQGTTTTKRKRNESDSSNHSLDEGRKKSRKTPTNEGPPEIIKAKTSEVPKVVNNIKKVPKVSQEESSDSDEPLIEKLRKPVNAANTQVNSLDTVAAKAKLKSGIGPVANNNKVAISTRRSVRSNMPAQNTRSKGEKTNSESEALRRKTRSAVLDVESKRKKEVK